MEEHSDVCYFFYKLGRYASEEVVLNLLRTKCLPVLLYGVEACPLLVRDRKSFDFTITRSFISSYFVLVPLL